MAEQVTKANFSLLHTTPSYLLYFQEDVIFQVGHHGKLAAQQT